MGESPARPSDGELKNPVAAKLLPYGFPKINPRGFTDYFILHLLSFCTYRDAQ